MAQQIFQDSSQDILQRLKNTPAQSGKRRQLLLEANSKGLLDVSRTGANVAVTYVPEINNTPLDDIEIALFMRKHPEGHENAGEDDGMGVFGGRSDPQETPIYTVLREMLEEMLDANMISPPLGISAEHFVKAKMTNFVESYPDAELDADIYTPETVRKSLESLQNSKAIFEIDQNRVIDLTNLSFVPMDEAVDLSFPMSVNQGSDIFDSLQVTKPYQFIYTTSDLEEFEHYLTVEGHETLELGEARGVKAFTLREVIKANKSGLQDYNPETDIRYTHEGFVAAMIALQHGADHSEVYAMHPAPKEMAEMMGISDTTFKEWHRRGIAMANSLENSEPAP